MLQQIAMIYEDEIQWTLQPIEAPRDETWEPTQTEAGMLAADVTALERRVESLISDVSIYRDITQSALDALTEMTKERERLKERLADQQRQIKELLEIG